MAELLQQVLAGQRRGRQDKGGEDQGRGAHA
jgi:hypothetical protein